MCNSLPLFPFSCFTFLSAPLLPCHHASPYLASIFDPLYHHRLPFHIDSSSLSHCSSFLLIGLHYDTFPMTHSSFLFIYKPLAQPLYFLKLLLLSLTQTSTHCTKPNTLGLLELCLFYSNPRTVASVQLPSVTPQTC